MAGTEFAALANRSNQWQAVYAKAGTGGAVALYTDGKVNLMNGNVGIGTTTPNYPLSLSNGLANTKLAIWDNGAGGAAFGLGAQASQFRFHLNGAGDRFSFLMAPTAPR